MWFLLRGIIAVIILSTLPISCLWSRWFWAIGSLGRGSCASRQAVQACAFVRSGLWSLSGFSWQYRSQSCTRKCLYRPLGSWVEARVSSGTIRNIFLCLVRAFWAPKSTHRSASTSHTAMGHLSRRALPVPIDCSTSYWFLYWSPRLHRYASKGGPGAPVTWICHSFQSSEWLRYVWVSWRRRCCRLDLSCLGSLLFSLCLCSLSLREVRICYQHYLGLLVNIFSAKLKFALHLTCQPRSMVWMTLGCG